MTRDPTSDKNCNMSCGFVIGDLTEKGLGPGHIAVYYLALRA